MVNQRNETICVLYTSTDSNLCLSHNIENEGVESSACRLQSDKKAPITETDKILTTCISPKYDQPT
jgi:hypothetical protein